MAIAGKSDRIADSDLPDLMRMMEEGSGAEKCRAIGLLCPCRNPVYDIRVWQKIFRALRESDPDVRDRAEHAVDTLTEYAQNDPRFHELLCQLEKVLDSRSLELLLESEKRVAERMRRQESQRQKIRPEDLSGLTQVLEEGTSEEQCQALRLLCPCRNSIYNREVWRKIFLAREEGDPDVQHQAEHAIVTLKQRALTDFRSWELLLQLEQEMGQEVQGSLMNVGWWGPRHRPSRRKRMTCCKAGRWKAFASGPFSASGSEDQ